MKKIFVLLSMFICTLSCRKGLKELPLYTGANIIGFKLETRVMDVVNQEVRVTRGDAFTISVVVDTTGKTVDIKVTPEVDLTKLVGIAIIDRAAIISPVDRAPKLGTPGDFSKPNNYKVTAADKIHEKTWTIVIHK